MSKLMYALGLYVFSDLSARSEGNYGKNVDMSDDLSRPVKRWKTDKPESKRKIC